MDTSTTVILILVWLAVPSAAVTWLMMRANAQIRRFQNAPTPKKLAEILQEETAALDERTLAHARRIAALKQELDDVQTRLTSLQNKLSAQARRDRQLDPMELADYIQHLQQSESIEPSAPNGLPPTAARTADGQAIDFR